MFHLLSLLWLLLCWVHTTPTVDAWGTDGHQMVANIAWSRLSNKTQAWVRSILMATSTNTNTSTGSLDSPLADIANWADTVRYSKFYHWSTPLHYVDIQDDQIDGGCPVVNPPAGREEQPPKQWTACHFVYARDCDMDVCAAGAIANYSTRLANNNNANNNNNNANNNDNSNNEANVSLKFLTHFVGDIHQPLHSARKTDKGGNTIHVTFDFNPDKDTQNIPHLGHGKSKSWNLHSIWDDGIIEKAMHDLYHGKREEFEQNLMEMIKVYAASGQLSVWLACADGRKKACTSIWAEESLESALSWAYRNVDGNDIHDGCHISYEYYSTRLQVVKQRIVAAGVRLAMTLELIATDAAQSHRERSYFRTISKPLAA